MGSAKDKFREFAIAFWKTSQLDLDRAEDALKEAYYSYAVFHSQQCVEKIAKALLEMEEVFVKDHDVSDMFATHILRKEVDKETKENFYKVLDILDWFKGAWALSRHPVIKDGKVISPFEQYDKKDAEDALEKARCVFEFVTLVLKEKYRLEIADEDYDASLEGENG